MQRQVTEFNKQSRPGIDPHPGKMQHIAAIDFRWPNEPWHDAVEMLEAMYSEFISLGYLPVAGKILSVADATVSIPTGLTATY